MKNVMFLNLYLALPPYLVFMKLKVSWLQTFSFRKSTKDFIYKILLTNIFGIHGFIIEVTYQRYYIIIVYSIDA